MFPKLMNLDRDSYDDPPNINDAPFFEPSTSPCTALFVVPLAYYLPSIYDEKD